MEDTISVLIPAFNRERYIKSCIESILAQTYTNIQVIVYDDGSTDNTVSIVRSFSNVKLIEGGLNKGVSHARNELLKACGTRYAAWQDSDDTAAPSRIEEQYRKMIETNAVLVFCHCVFMNKAGSSIPDDNIRCMGGVLFDVEKVKNILFNEQVKMGAEDNLWLAAINKQYGQPAIVPSQLYYIRMHPDRISNWKGRPEYRSQRVMSDKAYNEEMRRLNE